MKVLVTPEYLSDEEFTWFKQVGASWNKTMAEYAKGQMNTMQKNDSSLERMQDIEEALKDAIDDLMNNLDDDFRQDRGGFGFDGGDGIW